MLYPDQPDHVFKSLLKKRGDSDMEKRLRLCSTSVSDVVGRFPKCRGDGASKQLPDGIGVVATAGKAVHDCDEDEEDEAAGGEEEEE